MSDVISQEVNIEMREKLADGTYKKKNPATKASLVKFNDGTTVEEHKAEKEQHGLKLPILKGAPIVYPYVMPGWAYNGTQNWSIPDNNIHYIPIYVSTLTDFSKVGVSISTAVANTSVELRIYKADDLTSMPTDQVINLGTLNTATTGLKEISLEFSLPPGLFYVGIRAMGAPNLTSISSSQIFTSPVTSRLQATGQGSSVYTTTGVMNNPATLPTNFSTSLIPVILFGLKP